MTETNESCCSPTPHLNSAIEFPYNMRPHVSINVPELEHALPFYMALFGEAPIKQIHDYLKWEPASPPVNFTLNLHPPQHASSEDLGIEVDTHELAQEIANRLQQIGIDMQNIGSAYLTTDPYGNRWEIMVRNTTL